LLLLQQLIGKALLQLLVRRRGREIDVDRLNVVMLRPLRRDRGLLLVRSRSDNVKLSVGLGVAIPFSVVAFASGWFWLLILQLLLNKHELFLRKVAQLRVQRKQVDLLTLCHCILQGFKHFLLGRFPHS